MIRLDSFAIQGGRRLKGAVSISGSKNAALPCLFASLLTDETCVFENVPDLQDIRTAVSLLRQLGKNVLHQGHRVEIRKARRLKSRASYDLVRRMRGGRRRGRCLRICIRSWRRGCRATVRGRCWSTSLVLFRGLTPSVSGRSEDRPQEASPTADGSGGVRTAKRQDSVAWRKTFPASARTQNRASSFW